MNIKKTKHIFTRLQSLVDDEINLLDNKGYIFLSTNSQRIGDYDPHITNLDLDKPLISEGDYIYKMMDDGYGSNFILSIKGNNIVNKKLLQILDIFFEQQISNITKEDFFKEIILGNLEKDEIIKLSKELDISLVSCFQVFLIKVKDDIYNMVEDILLNMFSNSLLIKLSSTSYGFVYIHYEKAIEKIAPQINHLIISELLYEPEIGVGLVVENLENLVKSYEQAKLSIELGKVLPSSDNIYIYENLLLPVLIKNVDLSAIEEFSQSSTYNLTSLLQDNELLITALEFLENNLNISETARRLYIHRNTLIYRLNKIKKVSRLDLKNLEDAINFKILMFINNYIRDQK